MTKPLTISGSLAAVLAVALAVACAVARLSGDNTASASTQPTASVAVLSRDGAVLSKSVGADGSECLAYRGVTGCSAPGRGLLEKRGIFSFFTGHYANGRLVVDAVVGVAAQPATSIRLTDSAGDVSTTPLTNGAFILTGAALGDGSSESLDSVTDSGEIVYHDS